VVLVVAAKLGERFSGLRLLFGHEVLPKLAVRQLLFGGDGPIGVDVVAAVNEEIRAAAQHGGVSAHAAARLVDAPALAGGVARPQERDRAATGRSRAEATDDGVANDGR